MSSFLNISPKNSKILHEPIYKNALKLKKDAILIAENNKSYSTANSLLILSSEEVIKAILVLMHSEGYNVYKIQDAKKFFSDHKVRHQLAKMIEMFNGLIESAKKYSERKPIKLFRFKSESWNSFLNGIVDILGAVKPFLDSNERVKILESFNDNKNKGFYVDFREKILLPKDEIDLEMYNKTLEVVDRLFKTYKLIRLVHNLLLIKRLNSEDLAELDDFKNKVKVLIDEGLKDFSFKELSKI